jgi:hypothetical protein
MGEVYNKIAQPNLWQGEMQGKSVMQRLRGEIYTRMPDSCCGEDPCGDIRKNSYLGSMTSIYSFAHAINSKICQSGIQDCVV